MPQITVESKNIWQDRVQNRVDEHSDNVAMPQIPEEPDEATWLIRLKRFCAQIVDVLIARIQERLAKDVEVIPQHHFRQRTVRKSANRRLSCRAISQEQLGVPCCSWRLRKSACEIAPSNMFACVWDEQTGRRRGGIFKRACASACSGSHRSGLRG